MALCWFYFLSLLTSIVHGCYRVGQVLPSWGRIISCFYWLTFFFIDLNQSLPPCHHRVHTEYSFMPENWRKSREHNFSDGVLLHSVAFVICSSFLPQEDQTHCMQWIVKMYSLIIKLCLRIGIAIWSSQSSNCPIALINWTCKCIGMDNQLVPTQRQKT